MGFGLLCFSCSDLACAGKQCPVLVQAPCLIPSPALSRVSMRMEQFAETWTYGTTMRGPNCILQTALLDMSHPLPGFQAKLFSHETSPAPQLLPSMPAPSEPGTPAVPFALGPGGPGGTRTPFYYADVDFKPWTRHAHEHTDTLEKAGATTHARTARDLQLKSQRPKSPAASARHRLLLHGQVFWLHGPRHKKQQS